MVGDQVNITQVTGVCVYCEKVIFLPGMSTECVKAAMLKHIKTCPRHPLRGFNARRYDDDARGADEGLLPYRTETR